VFIIFPCKNWYQLTHAAIRIDYYAMHAPVCGQVISYREVLRTPVIPDCDGIILPAKSHL